MVDVQAEIGGSFLTLGIFRREGRGMIGETGSISGGVRKERSFAQGLFAIYQALLCTILVILFPAIKSITGYTEIPASLKDITGLFSML